MNQSLNSLTKSLFCMRRTYSTFLNVVKSTYANVLVKPEFDNRRITVEFETDKSKLHKTFCSTWLVHNCCCPKCKQAHSGQKLTDVSKLQPFYTLKDMKLDMEAEELRLTWNENCDHTTIIPLNSLLPSDNKHSTPRDEPKSFISLDRPFPKLDYTTVSHDDGYQLLKMINKYGVCLVTNSPLDTPSLVNLATKCGPIQETIYGKLFDVVTSREPINIAYSDSRLPLHMDLAYYESPPGIQFLHCLEFDTQDIVEGGESVIVDAWKVAAQLRMQDSESFRTLARIPASFQKIHRQRAEPVSMIYKRPHIVLDHEEHIIGINWSPAFEGPLDVSDPETAEIYYQSYINFAKLLENLPFRGEFRLTPGDILCFNNRRMVHGRNCVKRRENGRRHLRGCYVNIDEFKNKLRTLADLHEPDYEIEHIMNGSHY